eukprot:scaffold169847_cov34-Tisochrysis_lutea.AAC.2
MQVLRGVIDMVMDGKDGSAHLLGSEHPGAPEVEVVGAAIARPSLREHGGRRTFDRRARSPRSARGIRARGAARRWAARRASRPAAGLQTPGEEVLRSEGKIPLCIGVNGRGLVVPIAVCGLWCERKETTFCIDRE